MLGQLGIKEHWGIIYVHEQKLGIGECIRRLMDYAFTVEAEGMRNRSEGLLQDRGEDLVLLTVKARIFPEVRSDEG
ncbi:MAG: hypothetical protein ACUVXI_04115 [bacterium]